MSAQSPLVAWVTGSGGSGIAAQSEVVCRALRREGVAATPVQAKPLETGHSAPYITDDSGVIYPVDSLPATLLELDPAIVVFHSSNTHCRQALQQIQPHAITVSRLGVNLREQVLAGEQFIRQIPSLLDHFNTVDHLIASSERAARTMHTHGIRDDRLTTIPTAIDVNQARDPPEVAPDAVGTIGRIGKVKNQLPVIEAISGLREYDPPKTPNLYMAGDQNDGFLQSVKAFLPKIAPNFDVYAMGFVDDPLTNFYPKLGVHAHPSWTENCPQTLLEAAVAGVPSVVSDLAWADAYPFMDPIRCPPDDPQAWTDEFHRLLTDDEFRRQEARTQQAAVLDNYDISEIVEEYIALFEDLQDDYSAFKIPTEVRAGA